MEFLPGQAQGIPSSILSSNDPTDLRLEERFQIAFFFGGSLAQNAALAARWEGREQSYPLRQRTLRPVFGEQFAGFGLIDERQTRLTIGADFQHFFHFGPRLKRL